MTSRNPNPDVQHCAAGVTLVLALITGCTTTGTLDEHRIIGIVVAASGFPAVVRTNQNYIIDVQSRIYEGDIIQTDEQSKAHIEMVDSSRLEIGARSHVVFHQYEYVPETAGNARMTLTSGVVKVKTGSITTPKRARVEIRTPVATIGVHGGEVLGGFIFADNTLDVVLLDGTGVSVSNDHGAVTIESAGEGTTVIGGTAPQQAKPWSARKLDSAIEETVIR